MKKTTLCLTLALLLAGSAHALMKEVDDHVNVTSLGGELGIFAVDDHVNVVSLGVDSSILTVTQVVAVSQIIGGKAKVNDSMIESDSVSISEEAVSNVEASVVDKLVR